VSHFDLGGSIMRTPALFALLATALACALFAAPAQAQRDRVFVASYGSDSNPCTFGSPCKTFQIAVTVVAAGGEVTAIDSAGFGPVTVDKSVTITSPPGIEAGIAANPSSNAVTINAGPNDTVVLSGLTLEGAGSGAYGIAFNSGLRLEVVDCAIRNYIGYGIKVAPSALTSVLISNTIVADQAGNSQAGIALYTNGGGSIVAKLDHVTVNNNYDGVSINAQGGPIEALIMNSQIDNNINSGINTSGASNADSSSVVVKSVSLNQTPYGILMNDYSTIWLSQVTQTVAGGFPSNAGIYICGGSCTALSDGTNHLSSVNNGTLATWASQ
jgi:hypothetical protein